MLYKIPRWGFCAAANSTEIDIKGPGTLGGIGYCVNAYAQGWKLSCLETREVSALIHSIFLSGQLGDIFVVQTEQVEDIDQTFSVQTGRCFELDLGLGAPGDAKASSVKHQQVVGSVPNRQCLGDGDVVLGGDGFEEEPFSGGVDDGIGVDQFAGEGLRCGVDFELWQN